MLNPSTLIDADFVRTQLTGEFFGPADEGWDAARGAWNLAVDQHPDYVALPADADDVVALVRFAREAGLRVAAQGTGHNAAPLGSLERTMLIKTERMRAVAVDPEARIARVEAGATWGEVAGPTAAHGLMALQGSSHDVGVVGYSLGGGVPLIARKHGLAAERLRAVEIVTADGELRRVDRDNDPDLFWALRGGGGNFGVVTAVEIELLDRATVYAGALFFPIERGGEVLSEWSRWTSEVPEEMTSIGSLRNFPPMPEMPDFLRGQSFAIIEAYWLGTPEEGDRMLAPLRALGPIMDTVGEVDAVGLLQVHMDPPGPVPGKGDHQMLSSFDEGTISRAVAAMGSGPDAPLMFEVRHAGGALGRRAEGSGALGALEGEFLTFTVDILPAPELEPAVDAKLARMREALTPVETGGHYLNFAESSVEPETIFGDRLERLREVRDRYDAGMFRANHGLGA